MAVFAVLDTNVLVAAMITKASDSPTIRILRAVIDGTITPLYNQEIIFEYRDVLARPKFKLESKAVNTIILAIMQYGLEVEPVASSEIFPDEDDRVFYEVTLSKEGEGARLITGNLRHFPRKRFVVTPSEMVELLGV